MPRRVLTWTIVVLIGVGLGVASAWLVLSGAVRSSETHVGAWSVDLERGSEDAGIYQRAVTAVQVLLALAKEEAVYFVATDDDEGDALRPGCTYRVSGSDLPATWWSLTLYDGAYLPDNDNGRLSVDATSVSPETGDAWEVGVGPGVGESTDGWISTDGAERLNLVLRLYVPDGTVLADPRTVPVPVIDRLHCGQGR